MAVLGVSSVTPAFPRIVQELGFSSGQVGLLITVFTLPGIVLTPVLGVLSDRYGRKKILVPALLPFGVAGGACALARSFELLRALGFFQGMGAAAHGTLNVTVIGDIYGGRERSAALGYNSSVLSVGTASYPAIGSALATFGWFYPFALLVIAARYASSWSSRCEARSRATSRASRSTSGACGGTWPTGRWPASSGSAC